MITSRKEVVVTKDETMLSLYDYLKKAAGPELGKEVAKEATRRSVPFSSKEIDNPNYTGKILMYPKWFLDEYFNPTSPPPKQKDPIDDLPF